MINISFISDTYEKYLEFINLLKKIYKIELSRSTLISKKLIMLLNINSEIIMNILS